MKDNQLIFLISLPRSGSTMLQKIIGSHSDVYTRSEPWLMLHPLSMFRKGAIHVDYGHELAINAVQEFLGNDESDFVADKHKLYFEALGESFLKLYGAQLSDRSQHFFLDKTPRYFAIYDELKLTFPNAKFIILYRNPLAVLSSMIDTWASQSIQNLSKYKIDLDEGVNFLSRDFSNESNCHVVKYENLLQYPEREVASIQEFIGLVEDLSCIEYDSSEHWRYGDQTNVYEKKSPDLRHIDKWIHRLESPIHFQLTKEYLDRIGENKFSKLGFDFDLMQEHLKAASQNFDSIKISEPSLSSLFMSTEERQATIIEEKVNDLETALFNSKVYESEKIKSDEIIERLSGDFQSVQSKLAVNKKDLQSMDSALKRAEYENSRLKSMHELLAKNYSEICDSVIDISRASILTQPSEKIVRYKKALDLAMRIKSISS